MKHKIFTFLLAMIASTSMLFAASGTCGDNLTWDLTNGVLTISGTGAMTDYSYMASGITPWYSSRSSITSVVIGDGVTSIGNYAFYNCNYLSSVNIPNSVTSIGDDVFDRCNNLTSIVIPNSVTSIGSSSFYKCGITVPVYNSHVFAYMPPSYTGAYIIPSGIESIAGAAFSGCSGITSVTIPNSVTSIGHSAFYKCYSLTSVTIPNNVTSIDVGAFSNCSSLTSIIIPSSVTYIGNIAFSGCSNLTSVTWNAKNCSNFSSSNNAPFYDVRAKITSFVLGDDVEQIPAYLCYEMSNLTSVTLPNSVTSIESSAFYGCTGLTSITIPDNVTSIKSSAFSGCSNLTSVTWNAKNCPNFSSNSNAPFYNIRTKITSFVLGSEVEYIPSNLCYEMSNLTSITIPDNVTSIENSAFYGCTGLTSITIPDNVTSIKSSAFSGCSNLTSVTWNAKNCPNFSSNSNAPFYNIRTKITSFVLGSEVEYIPSNLCYEMSNLTSVTIPNSVTSIGNYAFNNCSGLTSVTIGNSVASIGSSAFYGCSGLTSVTIPNKVISIGSSAFHNCSGLTSVNIPDDVTSIGSSAFYGCSGLTSVTIGNSVTNIESSVFSGCNGLTSVTINSNAIVSKKYSSSSTIGSIFGSQVKEYIIGNSVDSIGDYAFYNRSNLESITLGNNITDIGKSAFLGCSNLTSIVIPNSVKNIGNYAFRNCTNLKAVTLGNSVTNINEYTFAGCTSLTSIDIPNGVTSIGSNAFNGCTGLTSVHISDIAAWCAISFRDIYANPLSYAHNLYLNGESVTDLVIPAGVTQIDDYAFYNCSELTSVEIPKGVTSIGSNAFNGCTSLTSIEIPNSVTSIGSNAFDGCNIANINYIGTIEDWCNKTWSVSLLSSNYQLRINGELLEHVTIPIQITNVNNTLFSGCNTLISIEIPNTVTNIASNAFSGCTGLTSVVWNATNCNSYNFGNQVESFIFGNEVEVIPASICSGMTNLKSVIIPNSVTSIGNNAFYNCSNLKSVIIPNSITSIGNYAFYNCTGLSFVEWDATEYELTKQLFPSVLDTLAVGAHFDTISLTYLPAKEVILRNPMTVVTNISHAAIKNGFYDKKGTGKMLAIYSDNKNVVIDNLYGMRLDTIGPDINIAQRYSGYLASSWIFCNINNDSVIDARNEGAFYESDNNGGYIPHEYVIPNNGSAPRKYNHIFQLDANLDGLQDFYSYEDNKHYFQLRQWDGSYLKTELNVLSDTAAIDSAIYQKWEKVSDEVVFIVSTWDEISLKNHMFIAPGDPEDQYSTGFDFIDMAIDLDRNGLVDLLSSSTGAVLYNLGDNTYVKGSFPGSVTPKDLNGDGILDYVIYNKTTKTVSLQIYEGNGNTTTKTLMQNMNISNVWCYDFDNDGDIDILLPFDWTSQSGYAYLVFFRNDGNNTFKKIENAFDDPVMQLEFIDCRDVDNDGKYEIIAREFASSTEEYQNYLIRYNNRFKVTLDRSFASGTSYKSEHLYVYGDFDQNGINDFYYNTRKTYEYALSHFPCQAINTPPAKMSQPRINVDSEKAMLKISWDRGSDAQTSSLDLEYSIRIGSTPGACDMWFAAANANGTQRSLWGANVGAYLSQMVNVSTWKAGDYYIAVQAVDPNGLGGEWSDEVVYHHSLLPYGFNVSDYNITTADTITVQYAGAIDENSTYNWNFGDSAVVLSQNGQTYTIIYTTQGNKTVSLQVTSADGRKSPLVTQEVNVLPIRIEKNANYPDVDDKYLVLSYFDMDMDGVQDGIGYKTNMLGSWKTADGFYKGRGDGSFIKLAKTFNSDLTVTGPVGECIFADVNMDGLPDVVTQTSKGSVMYNMEDFDVEFSNDTYTFPSTPAETYDFNNDGIADTYSIKNEHTILLHLQTDDEKETVEVYLPSDFSLNSLYLEDLKVGYDFDNNGHLDFISTGTKSGTKVFIIYLYDDYTTKCQYIDGSAYSLIYDIMTYPFVDFNSDGVPDLTKYILKSNITNDAPAVPNNLRAVQESNGVYLYWDAAKDKETPSAQMRYNISVKKKGVAVGTDNAFVVSPMNGLYDEANIVPGYYYPHGTSYFIPIDKLTGGQTYEFQIQSIDLWNAHSPMSAAYTFTVQPQVLISMPAQTCLNEPVTIEYTGTNNSGLSWNFDGGVASQNADGTYSVYWSTEGVKTVTATLSGNTSSRVIYVKNAQKDLTFALPERVLSNSWIEVTLPANYENLANMSIRTSINCTGYVLPKKDSRIFRVCFDGTPSHDSETGWVEFYQNDPVCGEVNTFRDSTLIVGNGGAPAISLVMVDATTGKNMVTWDAPANLPAYIDSMIVYKEEGKTNNWVMQAKVPVSAGQWIDQTSDPSVKSNAYCIAYTTIYGGESPKSKPHKTPHLQTNYGLNGAINLYWTSYEGDVVDSYQIMRGSSASSLQVLAIVAGNECTYTDNSPLEDGYYAIAYSNEAFTEEWISNGGAANAPAHKAMAQARQIRTGQSNIKASAASIQTILATHMTILSMEKTYTLSPSQQILHLYVEIMPFHSTYKQVRWSIVSGLGLATIYSNGLLVANTEGRNGTVRVRATAIDGSGVYAERAINVIGFKKTLTLSVNDINMGVVYGAGQYSEGQLVSISAEPNYGYHFEKWNDGNTDNPRTITFMQDTAFVAEFAKNTYTIITWSSPSGCGKTEGDTSILYLEETVISATPIEGYHFEKWNDGNTDNPRTITVTENKNYTATFAKNVYTITKLTNPDNCSIDGPSQAEHMQEVKLIPLPTNGYHFLQWSDGNADNPRTVVISQDTTFIAQFVKNVYTIQLNTYQAQQTWGTLTGAGDYEHGSTAVIAAEPNYGYHFVKWLGDDNTDNPRTVTVTENKTYYAWFAKNIYSVSVEYDSERGSVTYSSQAEYLQLISLSATPNTGYRFVQWSDGSTSTVHNVTITQDTTFTAVFEPKTYTITFLNDDGTTIDKVELPYGTMPTHENPTKPSNGIYSYTFTGWTPALVPVTGNATYTAQYNVTELTTGDCEDIHTIWLQPGENSLGEMTADGTTWRNVASGVAASGSGDDFLRTPAKNLTNMASVQLSFSHYATTATNNLTLWVCADFQNTDNDTWEELTISKFSSSTFVDMIINVPLRYVGKNTVFGFSYYSEKNGSWIIRNLKLDAVCTGSTPPQPTYYTIRFLNYNGAVLQSSQVLENTLPAYTGATPTRAEDSNYTYEFSGWSPSIAVATANADYTAQFTAIAKPQPTYYTIRFLNWDGTVLQSSQVKEGNTPSYTGVTPVRPEDEQYTYSFNGWTPTIVVATENADYTATYTAMEKSTSGCQDIHATWLETSKDDWGGMSTNNVEVWTWNPRYGAVGSMSGGVTAWLLTPQRDLSGKENITLSFSHVHQYAVDFESEMTLWISADYQGSVESSLWQRLPISPYASNTNWTYVDVVVNVPLDKVGEHTVFGFKYTSTANNSAKWEIENLHLDAQCSAISTGIEMTPEQSVDTVRKVLIDGQIFILRGDKMYTLTGQEVK